MIHGYTEYKKDWSFGIDVDIDIDIDIDIHL